MRKVALIGGPAAGDVVDSEGSRIIVPLFNDRAVAMPSVIPSLLKGLATYEVKRVRFGTMQWFVAKLEGDTAPINPFAILAGAKPSMYIFG